MPAATGLAAATTLLTGGLGPPTRHALATLDLDIDMTVKPPTPSPVCPRHHWQANGAIRRATDTPNKATTGHHSQPKSRGGRGRPSLSRHDPHQPYAYYFTPKRFSEATRQANTIDRLLPSGDITSHCLLHLLRWLEGMGTPVVWLWS